MLLCKTTDLSLSMSIIHSCSHLTELHTEKYKGNMVNLLKQTAQYKLTLDAATEVILRFASKGLKRKVHKKKYKMNKILQKYNTVQNIQWRK